MAHPIFWPTALLAGLFASSTLAQDVDCAKAYTQFDMNVCADQDYKAADAELNAAWTEAKATADAVGAGPALLDAQRKWIAYRDAACKAEAAQYEGGSIQPLIRLTCLTRLTERRSTDLREFSRP